MISDRYCLQIGRKAPPPHFCLLVRYSTRIAAHDVTSRTDISCIIEPHFGLWQKSPPPPPQDEGKFFDLRFIRFRQFRATLVFVAEKPPPPPPPQPPPPPRMRENFLTSDLSVSGNFEQLWFLWQKSPPPPPQDEGKFFDLRFIRFRQFRATLVFVAEKPPPPPPPPPG